MDTGVKTAEPKWPCKCCGAISAELFASIDGEIIHCSNCNMATGIHIAVGHEEHGATFIILPEFSITKFTKPITGWDQMHFRFGWAWVTFLLIFKRVRRAS